MTEDKKPTEPKDESLDNARDTSAEAEEVEQEALDEARDQEALDAINDASNKTEETSEQTDDASDSVDEESDAQADADAVEAEENLVNELNFPQQKDFVYKKTDFGEVAEQSIVEEIEKSYLDYAMSVIVARALPDARDGLKPVHRRIIFAMGEMGLSYSGRFTKSAKIVGEVLGKYHPHGDVAVYDTMVGLAQDFKMNHPLVKGQGNFGSMDGDSAAAARYTEAKMSKMTEDVLADIDKDTIDFVPNYDNTLKEPSVLPTKIPLLLVNGTVGIAVGMATNIPPHNLGELCDAIDYLTEHPDATIEDLMQFVKGPDFPTGAVIHGIEGIKNAFATGHGKVVIRGEAEITETKKGFQIIISSLPFQVNKSDLISKIALLVKDKKIEGITDLRDESDRVNAVRIVIELKSTAYPKKVLNRLYDLTSIQTAFHINMLALVDKIQPRVLTLKGALKEFIAHRQIVIRRRTEFDLARAKERAHILEGLIKALNHIDEIISIIKKSANREDAQKNLISKFDFSEVQANAILDMRLSALAALEQKRVEDELKEKLALIAELEAILADEKKVLEIVKAETKEIKAKYAIERRTKIIAQEIGSFKAEDLVPNENVIVTLTHGNYIKRVAVDSYRKQGRGGKGIIGATLKEEDQIIKMESASTHDTIFFFTNLGKIFVNKVYEIPASSRQAKGNSIVNFIQISPEEKVTTMLVIPKDMDIKDSFFLIGTKKGVVKKTAVTAYTNIRKTGLIAIKLKPSDELHFVKITRGKDYVVMVTKEGKGILYREEEARPMGRSAAGVIGMRLKTDDEVISMNSFDEEEVKNGDFELLTVLENGFGKRTQVLKNFPLQKRGGYGVIASRSSEKTGKVVEAIITSDVNRDLILVSGQGQLIRIPMKSAKLLGRDTQGVRLMKLDKNDSVASVSAVNEEKNEEIVVDANSEQTEASKESLEVPSPKEARVSPRTAQDASDKTEDNAEEQPEITYYDKRKE